MEKWLARKSFLPLLYLVVIAALIFIYITHYPPQIAHENHSPQDRHAKELMGLVRYGYPLVAGILIVFIITNPFSLQKHVRDLRWLKEGIRDQPPLDGSIIVVAGPITADNKPVITPAGRTSCIAYYYNLQGSSFTRSTELNYYGYAFTPSSINTSYGKVKILAVPHIDIFFYKACKTYYESDSNALNNFETYLRSTDFAESIIGGLPFDKEVNMSMTDRERPIRRDVWMKFSHRDPGSYKLNKIEEHRIDEGEEVCAFGMYSASQQGLVHNPGVGDPYSIQIKRGPIIKHIKKAISSIVRNLVGTACSLALLAAMVWVYQNL